MAKIFLDTNIFIDLIEKRREVNSKELDAHDLFISPLSAHILMYVTKKKIPYPFLSQIINRFIIINLSSDILGDALRGPTKDLEDNIQLHSASEADCDVFLTNDNQLLKLKSFGKTEVKSTL